MNGLKIVKSGCDFRELSEITIEFTSDKPSYNIKCHKITSDLAEDEEIAAVVCKYSSRYWSIHIIMCHAGIN